MIPRYSVFTQLSTNVWGKVYKYMRMTPPDFTNADLEKTKVEEEQRREAKEMKEKGIKFQSRFGFTIPEE